MVILAVATFKVQATYHRNKQKSPDQLLFGRDIILPINHIANWRLIRQRKQAKIDKDAICENSTRVDQDYRIGDWVTVRKKNSKYETLFKGPYEMVQN